MQMAPRMPTDEPHAAAQDEDAVQNANVNVFIRLLAGETAGRAEQVEEGARDEAVHVQDQIRLLFCGDFLHLERVVEDGRRREVALHVVMQQNDSHIRIVDLQEGKTPHHQKTSPKKPFTISTHFFTDNFAFFIFLF